MSIICQNIYKQFGKPAQVILKNINLNINDGEFVAISGKSGSGKSTLLYILSTLDEPTSGNVLFENENIHHWNVEKMHNYRNKNIGFIFQFHYLLPELTAIENVLLPARAQNKQKEYVEKAKSLLDSFQILDKANKWPSQMSGGEQQRVAIARALLLSPRYIFADEPTGNLDTHNGEIVMGILHKINQDNRTTILLVTHDPDYAKMAKREIYLVDGQVETDRQN